MSKKSFHIIISLFCRYDRALFFNAHIYNPAAKRALKKSLVKQAIFKIVINIDILSNSMPIIGEMAAITSSDHFDVEQACDDIVLGYDDTVFQDFEEASETQMQPPLPEIDDTPKRSKYGWLINFSLPKQPPPPRRRPWRADKPCRKQSGGFLQNIYEAVVKLNRE